MKLLLRALAPLVLSVPLAAHAADYEPPVFIEDAPEYVPVEVGSGWYLRGDVGYVFSSRIGRVDYTTYDAGPPPVYDGASFTSSGIDTDFAWGGGFGYRFTDFLRADATVEGFRGSFAGSTASGEPCGGLLDDTTCRSENDARFSAVSVMANGYVDLGTFVGFTPYVGAGAGMSYVRWNDLDDTSYCVDGADDCASLLPLGDTGHDGKDGWRFTYALMAGVAYDISRNFKLDVGYKYRNIDGGDMFGWDSGDSFGDGSHGDIRTHEFRFGLRYELW